MALEECMIRSVQFSFKVNEEVKGGGGNQQVNHQHSQINEREGTEKITTTTTNYREDEYLVVV